MYDETQRQLQITVDQYNVAQRRLQALMSELEEMRANLEAVRHLICILKTPKRLMMANNLLFSFCLN